MNRIILLLSWLFISQSLNVYAQWALEHPEMPQNGHYYIAAPPNSNQFYAFGHDMLLYDAEQEALSIQSDYDLPFDFKNQLTSFPSPEPHSNAFFSSIDTGFLIHREKILKTTDRGKNWRTVLALAPNNETHPVSAFFTDIYFPSAEVGYAVGTFGKIFKTEDAGESWSELAWSTSSAPYRRYSEVHFTNELEGYVIGYEVDDIFLNIGVYKAVLMKTEDGGQQWEEIQVLPGVGESDHHYARLSAVNDSILFLALINRNYVFPNSRLFRSTDKGATWDEIDLSNTTIYAALMIRDMHWFDEQEGILLASPSGFELSQTVYKTTDGGENWVAINLPTWPRFSVDQVYTLDMAFRGNTGIIVGSGGSLLRTDDRGNSWSSVVLGYPNLNDVAMHHSTHGYAVGNGGLILKKTGSSWDTITPPTGNAMSGHNFIRVTVGSPERVAVLNVAKEVYASADDGSTWELQLLRGDTIAVDVAYSNNQLNVLTLMNGQELVLLKRTNGSNNWTSELITEIQTTNENSGRIQLVNGKPVLISYEDQLFRRTPNSTTWDAISTQEIGTFKDKFHFHTDSLGWITSGSKIWKTTNGGQSWDSAQIINHTNLPVNFIISGFTSFSDSVVLAFTKLLPDSTTQVRDAYFWSTNGGESWDLKEIPFTLEPPLIGSSGWEQVNDTLFVVQNNGHILRLSADIISGEEEPVKELEIVSYPNPFRGAFRVKHPFPSAKVRLFDVQGRLVRHYPEVQSNELLQSNLDMPGTYWLNVSYQDQQKILKMILVDE